MERITQADLERSLRWYSEACERLGLLAEGETVGLDYGSKTYGRAYRVYVLKDGQGGGHFRPPAGDDFLGMTARDAYERLTDRARVLSDMGYALGVTR